MMNDHVDLSNFSGMNKSNRSSVNNSMKNETNFCQQEFPEESVLTNQLYLYIFVILVLGGLLGNLINILVFSSKPFRKHSPNAFILMLAISDSTYLFNAFFDWLIALKCLRYQNSSADILNHSDIFCKFVLFFLDLSANYSSMVILFFSIERLIAVYKPLKVRQIFTLKRTRILCRSLLIGIVLWIAWYHFMMFGVDETYGCYGLYSEWYYLGSILYIIEKLTFRVVPVLVIAAINASIICKIATSGPIGEETNQHRNDRNRQMTMLLILISVSYVILVLPLLTFYGVVFLNNTNIITVSEKNLVIARKWTKILNIMGFAVNFYLYSIGSKMFKEQLRKTFSLIRSSSSSTRTTAV